jgi:type IV secretory pathway VirB10-like protein
MADREGGSHPFNWFLIGFVVGVAATLAALLWLGMKRDHRASDDVEATRSAPAPASALPAQPASATPVLPAPPKKAAAPTEDHPHASQRESDEQMAEDAAAAGMTSRATPGQSSDPQ